MTVMGLLERAGVIEAPGPSVWHAPAAVNTCRLCGVPLVRSVDVAADEFCWRDLAGQQMGIYRDLAHLPPDPYGYLAGLADNLDRLHDRRKRRPEGPMRAWGLWRPESPHWLPVTDMAAEYTMLKVRLDLGTACHVHQARDDVPGGPGPLPWHCGQPGWHRPSGWQCRRCARRLLPVT